METRVSVIVPCHNEERYIRGCLESIIENDYPKDKMEVLVVDGRSSDRTREVAKEFIEKYPFIRLLDNPQRIVPIALNIGIMQAGGGVIVIMGAHAVYPNDYLSRLVYWLEKSGADCVGGILVTKPGSNTFTAQVIAITLSSPFGVGNSLFRTTSENREPQYVDTVPFGCYRSEIFQKIGLFNENLTRNQDIEFNLRLKREGGKILLIPDVVSYYHSRSTIKDLFKQNFWNGFWVIYSLKFAKLPFSIRHLVPFLFVLSLMGSLLLSFVYYPFIYLFSFVFGLYSCVSLFFCSKLSLKHGLKYLPPIILTFLTLHSSYGVGSLGGMFKLIEEKIR